MARSSFDGTLPLGGSAGCSEMACVEVGGGAGAAGKGPVPLRASSTPSIGPPSSSWAYVGPASADCKD
eukprot:8853251-Karenia_brevis.AAC.1